MAKPIQLKSVGHFEEVDGKDISETVYERPVMMVYEGSFESMDGPVDITSDHLRLIEGTHNSFFEKMKRLASGGPKMKDYPPLQLDHSSSAMMTVGRLVGAVETKMTDFGDEKRLALFGTARFLGRENIEKVKDGRWTNVSIGVDLESGKINELSVTPFPAAPNAALLSRPKLRRHKGVEYDIVPVQNGHCDIFVLQGGERVKLSTHEGSESDAEGKVKEWIDEKSEGDTAMHEKLKKHLMDSRKMSEEDAEKLSKEICDYQMKKLGKDESKMKAHLEIAEDKDLSRMSDEYDEEMKRLTADTGAGDEKEKEEAAEKEKAKMAAAKSSFITLAKGFKTGASKLNIELKKAVIGSRLSKFRSQAKISPAELKKLDLEKLSKLSDGELSAALDTFEAREPMVQFGAMSGTTKAEALETVARNYRLARMEAESRLNMPSKRAAALAQLSKLNEEESAEVEKIKTASFPTTSLHKASYDEMVAMLAAGKHDELKSALKSICDGFAHLSASGVEGGDDKNMVNLSKDYSTVQKQFDELVALASPVLGIVDGEI